MQLVQVHSSLLIYDPICNPISNSQEQFDPNQVRIEWKNGPRKFQ